MITRIKTDLIVPLKLHADIIGCIKIYNSVKVRDRFEADFFNDNTYMDPLATVMLRF